MTGEQWIVLAGMIINFLGIVLNAVLAFLAKTRAAEAALLSAAARNEMTEKHQILKSSLDNNTSKTESIEKAVNGNLDARVALAVQSAAHQARTEGIAIGIEQERVRNDATKAATMEAMLKAKKDESK